MNQNEALELIKQAVTMIQVDYPTRVRLIDAVKVLENLCSTIVPPSPASD